MQPTYLPWLGYFDMMAKADTFVLLDNVQFAKKSWQQRNRIKTSNGELMLTVPVISAGRFDQRICDTRINMQSPFVKKHCKTLELAYSEASDAYPYLSDITALIGSGEEFLASFNERIIRWFASTIGLETTIVRGSDLAATGQGTALTVNQLQELGADTFIAAEGSRPYVSAEPAFAAAQINVDFHQFQHPVYPQLHGAFVSHLSAVDALLNLGVERTRGLIG